METIEIAEATPVVAEVAVTRELMKEQGVDEREIKLAEKHGIIKKDEVKDEGKATEGTEKEVKEVKKADEVVLTPEEVAKNEKDNVTKLSKQDQAFYFQMKNERKLRQKAEVETAELEQQVAKASILNKKVAATLAALGKEDVTVEQLQAILNGEDNEPVTKAEFKKLEEEKVNQTKAQQAQVARFTSIMEAGNVLKEGFTETVKKVSSFSSLQGNEKYDTIISKMILDPSTSEEEVIDYIEYVATKIPTEASKPAEVKKQSSDKTDAQRAIENADKNPSSAATKGAGNRHVALDQLTADDVAKMPSAKWAEIRRKLSSTQISKILNS